MAEYSLSPNSNNNNNDDDHKNKLPEADTASLLDYHSPSKKAKKEGYLLFRGRKDPRVGSDFQVTALPIPQNPAQYQPPNAHEQQEQEPLHSLHLDTSSNNNIPTTVDDCRRYDPEEDCRNV